MTKKKRMRSSFDAMPDESLPLLAERFLKLYPPSADVRNSIQDILWSDTNYPKIPKRFRRELARDLLDTDLYLDAERFDRLLDELWVLDDDPFSSLNSSLGGTGRSLRDQIQQHVHRNPEDWSHEVLFDELGAFDAIDHRFALFLEGLASSDVRPDVSSQRKFAAKVNETLRKCGLELSESGEDEGYPVFKVTAIHGANTGHPKNLIFASPVKPDLRLRDAINNDIEIVTNTDKVLVYDRPISHDGLLWRDLQAWWAEKEGHVDDNVSKETLYRRLRDSLPSSSPPQCLLFDAFYHGFGRTVPNLPALLPEVWLHWDPETVQSRGVDAYQDSGWIFCCCCQGVSELSWKLTGSITMLTPTDRLTQPVTQKWWLPTVS